MSEAHSPNEETNERNLMDLRFLKAVDQLIEDGFAKNDKALALKIGTYASLISKIRNEGRSISLAQLHAAVQTFNLNGNFFLRFEDRLYMPNHSPDREGAVAFGDVVASGTGNSVIQGHNYGTIHADFEQIAENIYNQQNVPPELENNVNRLMALTKGIKKMNADFETENGELKKRIEHLQGALESSKTETSKVKDQLINLLIEERKGSN